MKLRPPLPQVDVAPAPALARFVARALAPLSVFQLGAQLLVALDESWSAAALGAGALLLGEAGAAAAAHRDEARLCAEAAGGAAPPRARAWRARRWRDVPARALVPGDLISLAGGTACPADVALLRGRALVDEATLTGEAVPVLKRPLLAADGGVARAEGGGADDGDGEGAADGDEGDARLEIWGRHRDRRVKGGRLAEFCGTYYS